MSKNLVFAIGDGKTIKTEIEDVDIYTLKYYPENPRIGSMLLNMSKKVTEELIYDLMWTKHGESVRELYQNIKTAGNVNEPLIVYNNKVLEGNTRLSVLRKLYKETKDLNWKTVKCRVIKDTLAPKDIDYLMCRINLADKKKDWEPFEQACYFYKLVKENGHSMKYIKEMSGFPQQKIEDYILTFEEMKKRKVDSIGFSTVYETLKQSEVKKETKKGNDVLKIVLKEYNTGKIDDARDPRKLKEILKSDKAKKDFLAGKKDIKTAYKYAKYIDPTIEDILLRDIEEMTKTLSSIPISKMQSIQKDQKKYVIVKKFAEQVKKFMENINKK